MMDLKPVEKSIMTTLMFLHEARFTDLNIFESPTDKFNYHLRNVINMGLIEKKDNGNYSLTSDGMKYVSHLDGFYKSINTQCNTIVLAICKRENNGRIEYLINKRGKQPMKDYYGLPGGKHEIGETLEESVLRELKE
ncbi:MAG: NUDIX domain-containing protein [bacterium]